MYKGEDKVLGILAEKGELSLEQLAAASDLNVDSVRRIVESLKGEGYAAVDTVETVAVTPTEEFRGYAEAGTPEAKVYRAAAAGKPVSALSEEEKRFGLPWARKKGFVEIEKGALVARKAEAEVLASERRMADAFASLRETGSLPDAPLLDELFVRNLVRKKAERRTMVKYTGKPLPERTPEFDISAPAADAELGKAHVITAFKDRLSSIMAEMGFEEAEGSIVESTFWNFDALFQPQDHPARDLADTFYLRGESPLPPDKALVKRVKDAHEKGWKYRWSEAEAKRTVLRTHTTALSARCLAAVKDKKPRKFFAIGRVFRNEATDFKHLAEFHQVEGIIAWEGATFADLLGVLREFYRKLGFEKIRFRPSFFPYTEPSLEVEVYYEPRGQWMELGGAGIFRPEVSIPLAGTYPVLAWGLSLERPLMLMLGLDDIRTFYRNDIDFLKKTRLPGLDK
jgi:phenylalanyl-tRNA synthetase alpha chain